METRIILNEDLIASWIENNVSFNEPIEVQAKQLMKFFEMFGLTNMSEYRHGYLLLEYLLSITIESSNDDIANKYITLSLVEAVRILSSLEGRLLPDVGMWE